MEVVSNLRPSKILAQCSTQRQSTLKFRRTLSPITRKQPGGHDAELTVADGDIDLLLPDKLLDPLDCLPYQIL